MVGRQAHTAWSRLGSQAGFKKSYKPTTSTHTSDSGSMRRQDDVAIMLSVARVQKGKCVGKTQRCERGT